MTEVIGVPNSTVTGTGAALDTATDALTDPAEFFRRADPSLRSGLAMVLIVAVARLLTALPLVWLFRNVIPRAEYLFVLGVMTAFMLVYAVLRWLVLAGVVYMAGRLAGGDGRFRELLAYIGWSHLPNLAGAALMALVTTAAVIAVPAPTTETAAGRTAAALSGSPFVRLSSAYGLVEARTGVSLGQLQYVLGVVQFAWGAVMWWAAAKVACGLEDRRALAAVALPVVVGGLIVGIQQVYVGVAI